ncbi:META domain-containing protein [Pseudarthrobacter sp. H2]|uniref:META domain-containing protein n=1 Tax=Pseudarthrobacter sp. H2 TaxID=3418415 RepID=UPI003CF22533
MHQVLALPLLAAVLAGCGGMPGAPAPVPEPAPTQKVPTQEVPSAIPDGPANPGGPSGPSAPDSPAGSPSPDSSAPPTPVLPAPYCEGGPLDCRVYRSVSGRDSSGELGWLNKQPLVVSSVFVNGTWTIGVKTPCNQLGVEVEVRAGQLIPGRTIATAMACLGPESGYEEWATQLFRQPVTLTRDGRDLVLRNSHGTVEFEDAGPNLL